MATYNVQNSTKFSLNQFVLPVYHHGSTEEVASHILRVTLTGDAHPECIFDRVYHSRQKNRPLKRCVDPSVWSDMIHSLMSLLFPNGNQAYRLIRTDRYTMTNQTDERSEFGAVSLGAADLTSPYLYLNPDQIRASGGWIGPMGLMAPAFVYRRDAFDELPVLKLSNMYQPFLVGALVSLYIAKILAQKTCREPSKQTMILFPLMIQIGWSLFRSNIIRFHNQPSHQPFAIHSIDQLVDLVEQGRLELYILPLDQYLTIKRSRFGWCQQLRQYWETTSPPKFATFNQLLGSDNSVNGKESTGIGNHRRAVFLLDGKDIPGLFAYKCRCAYNILASEYQLYETAVSYTRNPSLKRQLRVYEMSFMTAELQRNEERNRRRHDCGSFCSSSGSNVEQSGDGKAKMTMSKTRGIWMTIGCLWMITSWVIIAELFCHCVIGLTSSQPIGIYSLV